MPRKVSQANQEMLKNIFWLGIGMGLLVDLVLAYPNLLPADNARWRTNTMIWWCRL